MNVKHFIIAILILSLLLTMMIGCKTTRDENQTFYEGDYLLGVQENECYIIRYNGKDENITLPTITKDGRKIIGIGSWAFSETETLKVLDIPVGYVFIDSSAFYKCSNLGSIKISKTVSVLSEYDVFAQCNSLSNFVVDENNKKFQSKGQCILTKDGERLIYGCKDSVIPEGTKTIGKNAFCEIESLTTITIPQSVTVIEEFAFFGCLSLKNVVLHSDITSVGLYAFVNCPELTVSCDFAACPGGWDEKWCTSSADKKYPEPQVDWIGQP